MLVGDDHSCVSSLKRSPNLRWTAISKADAQRKAKADAETEALLAAARCEAKAAQHVAALAAAAPAPTNSGHSPCRALARGLGRLGCSRAVLRERFSSFLSKPVYTFTFDRFTEEMEKLHLEKVKELKFGNLVH